VIRFRLGDPKSKRPLYEKRGGKVRRNLQQRGERKGLKRLDYQKKKYEKGARKTCSQLRGHGLSRQSLPSPGLRTGHKCESIIKEVGLLAQMWEG